METRAVCQTISPPETSGLILKNLWRRVIAAVGARKPRRLRVRETLSLGERRFVALIEFDRQEILVGGTGNSLEVLARLQDGMIVTPNTLPRASHPV